jgi:hypothetical protein
MCGVSVHLSPLSRRGVLKVLATVMSGAVFSCLLPELALAMEARQAHYLIVGCTGYVCRFNIQNYSVERVPVDFDAHSFIDAGEDQVWAIQKWARQAVLVDFKRGTVIRRLDCPEDAAFYGHGMVNDDGVLLVTRVDLNDGTGHLVGYRKYCPKPIVDYKVTPGFLHECRPMANGDVLISSSGLQALKGVNPLSGKRIAPSSLIRFNLDRRQVVETTPVEDDAQVLGHFIIAKNGAVLAVSGVLGDGNVAPGKIYFRGLADRRLREVTVPADLRAQMHGELLSLALDEGSHQAIVTVPKGEMILMIDMEHGQFVDVIMGAGDTGAVFDKGSGRFLVTNRTVGYLDLLERKRVSLTPPYTGRGTRHSAHVLLV